MLQYRVGVFFGGATLAGAFSGLLAFVISFMAGTAGLEGWAWIFVRRSSLPSLSHHHPHPLYRASWPEAKAS